VSMLVRRGDGVNYIVIRPGARWAVEQKCGSFCDVE